VAGTAATKLTARDASASSWGPIVRDVCVIGGGSAGTYAAVRLRDMGTSIVVVEKKGRLGGHAETVYDPATGTPIDIGVVIFENDPLVTNYFGRFEVPLVPFPLTGGTTAYVVYQTGRVVSGYQPPGPAQFGAALFTYLTVLQQFPYLDSGFQLPNPVPLDLLLPFGQFVQKYALAALVPTVFQFGQGLGTLLADPALYVLKNFSLSVAGSLATTGFLTAPTGSGSLYDAIAQSLIGDVLFDADVVRVDRRGHSGIEVDVVTPYGLQRIQCEKLVFATPPTADNLRPFDLDRLEARTLTHFRTNYYATALVRLTGLPPSESVQNTGADTQYNLPVLPGIYGINPTAAPDLYNVKFGSPFWLPNLVVQAKIVKDITKLRLVGTFPVSFKEFIAFSSHAPFEMMVPSEEIAAGFYATLNALQGRNNTFYTGAAFQTNDSFLIWEYTEGLLPQIVA
jgi:hypothetical protein